MIASTFFSGTTVISMARLAFSLNVSRPSWNPWRPIREIPDTLV